MGSGFDKTVLLEDLLFAAFRQTFFDHDGVWNKKDFQARLELNKAQLVPNAQALEKLLMEVVDLDYSIRSALPLVNRQNFAYMLDDIEQQRARLLSAHFIFDTPSEHLRCLPRYLKAMKYRIERVMSQAPKDKQATQEMQLLTERWQALLKQQPLSSQLPSVVEYRWLLEEYRVSLFAQQLKTRVPVSRKRLDTLWQTIEEDVRRTFL